MQIVDENFYYLSIVYCLIIGSYVCNYEDFFLYFLAFEEISSSLVFICIYDQHEG